MKIMCSVKNLVFSLKDKTYSDGGDTALFLQTASALGEAMMM